MSKKNPIVLAVVSDLHSGSSVGLMPPVFNLDDGGTFRASKAQRWLWQCWLDFCGQVEAKADALGARIITVVNGDVTEGNHHHSLEVVTANETTQMRIAYKCLEQLVMISDDVFMTRGTPVHVGASARMEERVADDIMNIVRESEHAATFYHLPLKIYKTVFDIAHHGNMGRLPWTEKAAGNKLAAIVIMDAATRGEKPPDVVIRSHMHRYADSYQNFQTTRGIMTPAWQLVTGYINKLNPGALADIGGLIITVWPNGNYDVEVCRYRPKKREPVKVTDILDAIFDAVKNPEPGEPYCPNPNEITRGIVEVKHDLTPYMADKMLKQLVQDGRLVPAMVEYVNMWGYQKATMGYRLVD
jgi:hypothetical protein